MVGGATPSATATSWTTPSAPSATTPTTHPTSASRTASSTGGRSPRPSASRGEGTSTTARSPAAPSSRTSTTSSSATAWREHADRPPQQLHLLRWHEERGRHLAGAPTATRTLGCQQRPGDHHRREQVRQREPRHRQAPHPHRPRRLRHGPTACLVSTAPRSLPAREATSPACESATTCSRARTGEQRGIVYSTIAQAAIIFDHNYHYGTPYPYLIEFAPGITRLQDHTSGIPRTSIRRSATTSNGAQPPRRSCTSPATPSLRPRPVPGGQPRGRGSLAARRRPRLPAHRLH